MIAMPRTLSLLLTLLAGPAFAQSPPSLEHQRVEKALRGEPLRLSARIRAAAPATVFEPTAFLRPGGAEKFQQLPLFLAGGDLYEAVVPGALTRTDFEYYLEAFDSEGRGPARAGLPKEPLRVQVHDPVPAAAATPALPPPGPSALRPAGIALTATGAASLAAGAACVFLAASSLEAERQASRDGDAGAWDRAHAELEARRTAAYVLLPVGLAAAATGVVLWILAPSAGTAGVAVAPEVGAGRAGLLVSGQF